MPATIIVSGTLRVRVAPNADADILGRLREGITVTLLARTADSAWWQIAFPNTKQRGWISADFANPLGDTNTLPIRSVAPTAAATPTHTLTDTPTPESTATPVPDTPTPPPTFTPTPTPTASFPWKDLLPFLP